MSNTASFTVVLVLAIAFRLEFADGSARGLVQSGSSRSHVLHNQEMIAASLPKADQVKLFKLLVKLAEDVSTDTHNMDVAVAQLRAAFLPCPTCKFDDFQGQTFREVFLFDHLEDRQYLMQNIFPAVMQQQEGSKNALKLLWAGTHPFTLRYEYMLKGIDITTIDPNPEMAVYGSNHRHIVDILQKISKYEEPGTFDLVIANGVLGWGINTDAEVESFVKSVHASLKPGGLLVVGFNRHLSTCCSTFSPYFDHATFQRLPQRKDFDGVWQHSFEIFRRKG